MSDAPEWLSRDLLPGGFVSDTLPAGGKIRDWERQAFEKYGCPDRESLNRFFLGSTGRKTLIDHYHRCAFTLRQPEEGALMSLAVHSLPAETSELLEPHFPTLRFYPRLLQKGFPEPPPGQCFRYSCAEALKELDAYELPLEVRRKRESLRLWRPFFHRLLSLLEETQEEGWPFQRYPVGWKSKAQELAVEIEKEVSGDVLCAYPHRADSDFRRLLSITTTATQDPAALSGREVAFCKTLWEDTLKKRGRLKTTVPVDLPGDDILRAVAKAQACLRDFPPQTGFPGPCEWVSELPRTVRRKVLKARQASLIQLRDLGLINSLETLDELAPQVVSGVLDCPLLSRSYRAHNKFKSTLTFEALPWIAPNWRPPDPGSVGEVVSELLGCWWKGFGYRCATPTLHGQLQTLARWSGKSDWLELAQVSLSTMDLHAIIKQCRSFLERQGSQESSRPYERLQRDKRIEEAEKQLAFFEAHSGRVNDPVSESRSRRHPNR